MVSLVGGCSEEDNLGGDPINCNCTCRECGLNDIPVLPCTGFENARTAVGCVNEETTAAEACNQACEESEPWFFFICVGDCLSPVSVGRANSCTGNAVGEPDPLGDPAFCTANSVNVLSAPTFDHAKAVIIPERSVVDVTAEVITLDAPLGKTIAGSFEPTGELTFAGGFCDEPPCNFALLGTSLRSTAAFDVDGLTVESANAHNDGPSVGSVLGDGSIAIGLLSASPFEATTKIDGTVNARATRLTGLTGVLDEAARELRLVANVAVGEDGLLFRGGSGTATLVARLEDVPPVVVLDGEASARCGVPHPLSASRSRDVDGDIVEFVWFEDTSEGRSFLSSAESIEVSLSSGHHLIGVRVRDDDGRASEGFFGINVSDEPPIADIAGDHSFECDAAASGSVVLSAEGSSDPDGGDLMYSWMLGESDGPVLGTGPTLSTSLPLGEHLITLVVTDACGSSAHATAEVVVEDTTPPQLSDFAQSGPMCLWPPNHDYVVLEVGDEFTGVVLDVCDPDARLRVLSATSSQPDDDLGDGSTSSDVVLFDDRVCLRTERAGPSLDAREYSVHLGAVDETGNTSDPVVVVRVVHDQRGHDCPALDVDEFVDDGDARCSALSAATPADPPSPTDEAMSCSSSGHAHWSLALAALLGLRRWRRGRRRERSGVFSFATLVLVTTIAGCHMPDTANPVEERRDNDARAPEPACMPGWWRTMASSCGVEPLCAGSTEASPSVCEAADCSAFTLLGFLDDGDTRPYVQARAVAASGSTILCVDSAVEGSWDLEGTTLRTRLGSSEPTLEARCTENELTVDGLALTRLESQLVSQLTTRAQGSEWIGCSSSP